LSSLALAAALSVVAVTPADAAVNVISEARKACNGGEGYRVVEGPHRLGTNAEAVLLFNGRVYCAAAIKTSARNRATDLSVSLRLGAYGKVATDEGRFYTNAVAAVASTTSNACIVWSGWDGSVTAHEFSSPGCR
jgi:hypothetical protein